jgi:hypothetical protein
MFKTFLYAKMYQLTDCFEMMTSKPATSRSFKNKMIIILLFSCTETGGADGVDQSAELELLEEAWGIVQFAEDNIAFDDQKILLTDALRSEDTKQIETAFLQAQQKAAEMLDGFYKEFCTYLLQECGLLRKGD